MAETKRDWLASLLEEHSAISKHLALVKNEVTRSQSKSPEKLMGLVDDLGARIAKHITHEEQSLYKQLKIRLKKDSPTDEMIMEHELIRNEFATLRHKCAEYETVDSYVAISQSLDSLQRKLGEHMKKEEKVLYWLADIKLNHDHLPVIEDW